MTINLIDKLKRAGLAFALAGIVYGVSGCYNSQNNTRTEGEKAPRTQSSDSEGIKVQGIYATDTKVITEVVGNPDKYDFTFELKNKDGSVKYRKVDEIEKTENGANLILDSSAEEIKILSNVVLKPKYNPNKKVSRPEYKSFADSVKKSNF